MRDSQSASFEPFNAEPQRADETNALPETLPPVEPPSARFIVQLFLIPALIVGAVIGVYLLFGRLATGELDWRQQVDNVRSQNPHVRWRGALSLAQMLDADAHLGTGADDQRIAENPEVASALTELFAETRGIERRDEQTQAHIEFLAKALGRLDAPETVFPALLDAVNSEQDELVRKHSLTALAMIAGRALERGEPLGSASIVAPIVAVSQSSNPLDRHQAAFILGLLSSPEATHRLEVLLQDGDLMTRANAAVGLARHQNPAGMPVFEEVFADAVARPIVPQTFTDEEEGQAYFERTLLLKNSLHAAEVLGPDLDGDARGKLVKLLEQVADATQDAQLSINARELSLKLGKPSVR